MSRKKKTVRRSRKSKSASHGSLRLGLVLAVLVGVNLYVLVFNRDTSIPAIKRRAAIVGEAPEELTKEEQRGAAVPKSDMPSNENRVVAGEVAPGDTMGQVLTRHEVGWKDRDKLLRSIGQVLDLRKIRAGQQFWLYFDGANAVAKFEFAVSRAVRIVVKRKDGKLVAEKIEANPKREPENLSE